MRMRARNNTDTLSDDDVDDDGDDDDHCLREVYANVGALIRVRRRHRAASVVGAYTRVSYIEILDMTLRCAHAHAKSTVRSRTLYLSVCVNVARIAYYVRMIVGT